MLLSNLLEEYQNKPGRAFARISDIFNKHKDNIKDKYIEVSNDDNKMHGF